jgi:[histone H3]-lysine4 N-trimethyltransferase SETD1
MPPPAGASFAQFFPTAPRAARDRALEREKARLKTADSPSSADQNGRQTPSARPDDGTLSAFRRDVPILDGSRPPADDLDSLPGDTLHAIGSASSHASTASTVFSSSARQNGMPATVAKPGNHNQLTPLTSTDSPTPPMTSYLHGADPSLPQFGDVRVGDGSISGFAPNGDVPVPSQFLDRMPARDTARKVQGIRCTYDPLLDKTLSASEKRKGKPTFENIGLVRAIILYSCGEGGVIRLLSALANMLV